ncbi:hypothetical protein [Thermodesulfatator atlanticus]|uniref:hypothetical protein n=1 Tax=Thermodesulfatator atlanticus TaxID=501497 RepID=UPI001469DEE1|nr:hypothetical protein [Thermodesulfatator atlanticus]
MIPIIINKKAINSINNDLQGLGKNKKNLIPITTNRDKTIAKKKEREPVKQRINIKYKSTTNDILHILTKQNVKNDKKTISEK